MEKTLESIFIKQYEDMQNELYLSKKQNEELQTRVNELEEVYLNKPLEQTEDKKKLLPTFRILYRPDVMPEYNFKELKSNHTLDYFKSLLTDDKKLRRFMNEKSECSYSTEFVMCVNKYEVNHYCQYGNETLYFRVYEYNNHLDANTYSLDRYYLTEEEAYEAGKQELIKNIKKHIERLKMEQTENG